MPAPARDDDLGLGQLRWPSRTSSRRSTSFMPRPGRRAGRPRRPSARLGIPRPEHVGPQRGQPRRLRPRHLGEELAGVDGPGRHEPVAVQRQRLGVGGQPRAQPRGQPRHQLALPLVTGARMALGDSFPARSASAGAHTSPRYGARRRSRGASRAGPPLAELLQPLVGRLVGEPHGFRRPRGPGARPRPALRPSPSSASPSDRPRPCTRSRLPCLSFAHRSRCPASSLDRLGVFAQRAHQFLDRAGTRPG